MAAKRHNTTKHRSGNRRSRPARGKTSRKVRYASIGALFTGAGGVALASAVGVGELFVGGFLAYVVYRVLRYGVEPTEAIIEGVEIEHGERPKDLRNVA